MAGKKKERVSDDPHEWRSTLLVGVTQPIAIALYDNCMAELTARGQANYFAAMQLRDAALWTQEIEELRDAIRMIKRGASGAGDGDPRIQMRNKALAEKARRDILDALLLTPQRPRGRPPREGAPEEESVDEGDAWEDFDKPDGGGGA